MNKTEYEKYLFSEEWKRKAEQRLQIDNYRCVMCGSMGTRVLPLEVHHITYRRIGKEDVYKDLLTLCRSCHRNTHRMMDRITGYRADGSPVYGWKDQLTDYTTHVYTLDGSETGVKYG